MVLQPKDLRSNGRDAAGHSTEGGGGNFAFVATPSVVSRALPPAGMLAIALLLSAMLVGLVTAALL